VGNELGQSDLCSALAATRPAKALPRHVKPTGEAGHNASLCGRVGIVRERVQKQVRQAVARQMLRRVLTLRKHGRAGSDVTRACLAPEMSLCTSVVAEQPQTLPGTFLNSRIHTRTRRGDLVVVC